MKKGEKGNVLRVYEDKPIYYDNWDIDIYYNQKSWIADDVQSIEWLENGPVRAVLEIRRKFLESTIVQKVIFYTESRRIDFDTYVDWKQHQLLMKAEFPVDINTNEAVYDIQFGTLKRPTHTNTSWEAAKFEVCGHKFADLSENGYGVALMNDCKYGYDIHEGKMTLSLIKSGILPNPTTDQEEHWFTYALMPHMDGYAEADVQNEAYCLNVPAYAVKAKNPTGALKEQGLFEINCNNVIVETVKQAEDGSGTIIRMYEAKNRRTSAEIKWNVPFAKVVECNLIEEEIETVAENAQSFSFKIKPFEIRTFKIVE